MGIVASWIGPAFGCGVLLLIALYIRAETQRVRKTPRRQGAARRAYPKSWGKERPEPGQQEHPPDYNPETGQWQDWDGTPYGAIDAEMEG